MTFKVPSCLGNCVLTSSFPAFFLVARSSASGRFFPRGLSFPKDSTAVSVMVSPPLPSQEDAHPGTPLHLQNTLNLDLHIREAQSLIVYPRVSALPAALALIGRDKGAGRQGRLRQLSTHLFGKNNEQHTAHLHGLPRHHCKKQFPAPVMSLPTCHSCMKRKFPCFLVKYTLPSAKHFLASHCIRI